MSNIAISEVLGHMKSMKKRIQAQQVNSEKSIERHLRDRTLASELITGKKTKIADGDSAIRWLDAEIDRLGRT